MKSDHPRRANRRKAPVKAKTAASRHLRLLSFASDEVRLPVDASADIMLVRRTGWRFATRLGFSAADATLIAAITSELARNIVHGCQRGRIVFSLLKNGGKRGIKVVARYPQSADARAARPPAAEPVKADRRELAGVGKLVDEFTVAAESGSGITVTMKKWQSG